MVQEHERFINEAIVRDPSHRTGWRKLRDYAHFLKQSGELPPKLPVYTPEPEITGAYLHHELFDLDLLERRFIMKGEELELPHNGFNVIAALALKSNKVVTRDELLDIAYPEKPVSDRVIDVQVLKIRRIIMERNDINECPIETVHGLGYRLKGEVLEL